MISRSKKPMNYRPWLSVISSCSKANVFRVVCLYCALCPIISFSADSKPGSQLSVDINGAVINAGVVVGAGIVAKQAIGDLKAGIISNDSISVSLPSAVNVSASMAGYADSEQNVGDRKSVV